MKLDPTPYRCSDCQLRVPVEHAWPSQRYDFDPLVYILFVQFGILGWAIRDAWFRGTGR